MKLSEPPQAHQDLFCFVFSFVCAVQRSLSKPYHHNLSLAARNNQIHADLL